GRETLSSHLARCERAGRPRGPGDRWATERTRLDVIGHGALPPQRRHRRRSTAIIGGRRRAREAIARHQRAEVAPPPPSSRQRPRVTAAGRGRRAARRRGGWRRARRARWPFPAPWPATTHWTDSRVPRPASHPTTAAAAGCRGPGTTGPTPAAPAWRTGSSR